MTIITLFLVNLFHYFILFLISFFYIEILESGWKDDRQLEHKFAQKDLQYIDDLTVLLKHTEKRKAKVGTIVRRLIGELQQLKYYLEGMSNPPTPALPSLTPSIIHFLYFHNLIYLFRSFNTTNIK